MHMHHAPMHAAKLGAVVRLFQLLDILPATNATSERSFRALRSVSVGYNVSDQVKPPDDTPLSSRNDDG